MQLLVIKKEKEDLEKLVNKNKSKRFYSNILKLYSLILFLMVFQGVTAQETSYVKGNEYIIEDITVSGLKSFNEQTVITYTGLRKGDLSLIHI